MLQFHVPPLALNPLLFLHVRHAIKTGLAATLTFGVSSLLGSQYSIWGVISAIIVMQGISVTDSIIDSFSRFTGMSLGALAGMVLLMFAPTTHLLLGLEIFFICTLGAYLRRYGNRFTLATTAVCIVLLVGQKLVGGPLSKIVYFGFFLSIEVLVGVISAVLVSAFIWPVRLGDALRSDIGRQFQSVSALLDVVVNSYIEEQTHVSDTQFEVLRLEAWSNHERMGKVKKLEAHIYQYEHQGLAIQVETIERFLEGMRSLIDALNEYDEESFDPLLCPELRALADQMQVALNHLGGEKAYTPAPEIVRSLTSAVDVAESRLIALRGKGSYKHLPLHRVLQLYSFYQVLRQLSEELLYALYEMETLGEKPLRKKKIVHPVLKRF